MAANRRYIAGCPAIDAQWSPNLKLKQGQLRVWSGSMSEPQPIIVLLIVFLIALGMVIILSARKIYEYYRRYLPPSLMTPKMYVLNYRFGGALMILFALILLWLAISN
jgi:hypothetical protein